jgi:hypothetical protein
MKILKYIVIFLFLFSALFISRKYASFIDLRIEYTRAFLKFLEHIEGKMSSYLSPPNELGEGFEREELLTGVKLHNTKTGERYSLPVDGLFVAIGHAPENKAFESITALDSYGYITADERCTTDTQGVFVAGDCRTKAIRQITTATADGAVAALAACKYIDSL